MGEVITFAPEVQRDIAWNDYQEVAAKAVANPRLLLDREFFDELTRREDRYKRLLLVSERGR